MRRLLFGAVSGAVAALLLAQAVRAVTVPTVTSRWKDAEIAVDGEIGEWPVLMRFPEGVSAAAANDGHDLYLAVATSDIDRRRQLIAEGLTIWLDVKGGKNETWGISFPRGATPMTGSERSDDAGDRSNRGGEPADSAVPVSPTLPRLAFVDLLGPGKLDRRRLALASESAIAAGRGLKDGTLLFELKIPLGVAPKALDAKVGKPLGLGLQTPPIESAYPGEGEGYGHGNGGGMRGGRGGFRGGIGGMGGRGGGYGGGRGEGGSRGRGEAQPKALKIWTTLTLAQAPK